MHLEYLSKNISQTFPLRGLTYHAYGSSQNPHLIILLGKNFTYFSPQRKNFPWSWFFLKYATHKHIGLFLHRIFPWGSSHDYFSLKPLYRDPFSYDPLSHEPFYHVGSGFFVFNIEIISIVNSRDWSKPHQACLSQQTNINRLFLWIKWSRSLIHQIYSMTPTFFHHGNSTLDRFTPGHGYG